MKVSEGFDFIIIGAGSSGGVLAFFLARHSNARILLLEAGPPARHWSVRMPAASRSNYSGGPRNWCFETLPEPHMNQRRIFQPRGKVIGGSSSLNGMVYVRGHPRDYEAWQQLGAHGWGYDDLLPYFRKIETYRGTGSAKRGDEGPIKVERLTGHHPMEEAFLQAARQAGHASPIDYNAGQQEGVTAFDANIDNGIRSGSASACVAPIAAMKHVVVMPNSRATKIIFEKGRACAVEAVHDSRLYKFSADQEIILCAGAFQSPQLLMLSGIGPADHLTEHNIKCEVDLPGVGRNLQDHLEVHLKFRGRAGQSKNRLLSNRAMILAGMQWFALKTGVAATTHSRVGAFLRTGEDQSYPNMQFHFWPYFLEGWSPPPNKDGYCFDVGPTRSVSRGWVKLASADPFDNPLIQLNGLANKTDLAEFRACIALARDIASQQAFDFCRGSEVLPGPGAKDEVALNDYIRNHANSAYHPCGTCRMGVDKHAVVSPTLQVHGVTNLRVADASIMPQIPNGNINAPCFMIGARAADFIL